MSKKNSIFVSCEDANHLCDKAQYKEASIWEKIKLNLHLLYCRACRKYTKNNHKLTQLTTDPQVECLEVSEKEKMRKLLEQEFQKSH